ncbi:pilus biosynthesis protein [Undibacterium sp. YM2]|uniref:type IV pilin protein n=1 Tax=Undibacterium sp. YM2 TaxID=2058625 RepID=UPI001331D2B1|nr:type IV pilin protein [Undibacterium sp. YM2]BBB65636.1 pilus biosynthesis protein [Undibacterium sp. YM2]
MLIKKSEAGFTLIEILIVVVILGILAAISVPAYTDNVRRSRRADARSVLTQNAQFMQSFMTANDRYDKMRDNTPVALPMLVSPVGATGSNIDYDISFTIAPTATTFSVRAVPRAGGRMAADGCGTYAINESGARSNVGNTLSVDTCWTK